MGTIRRISRFFLVCTMFLGLHGYSFAQIPPIEMIYVEGSTFTRGCVPKAGYECENNDELPAYKVTVNSFYIAKYPVTQALWKAVMGKNPSKFEGDDLPVENVSWNDAQEFIRKLNTQTGKTYRLPTEAEWEFAARGGVKSQGYIYSGSDTADEVAWYIENSGNKTHPVGLKKANELGIYDMNGNVHEWCNDWYNTYNSMRSQTNNPQGLSRGTDRVFRGGSWEGYDIFVTIAFREHDRPNVRLDNLGFRLASTTE